MNKKKRNLIIALSFSVLAFGVVGAANMNAVSIAKANEELKFEMTDGAAVRLARNEDDKSGIRWETTLNTAFYNSLNIGENPVELGVLVAPAKNIGKDEELTISTLEVDSIPCSSAINFNQDGEFTYYSSIVYDALTEAQQLKAYAIELAARAYIKIGDSYTYVNEYNTTRSMRAVAYEALNNGYTLEQVGKYFGDVEECDIMSGYYSEVDAAATLTNVNNLAKGTYSASVKAQPVSVVVNSDSTMTVSGELYGFTAGEKYELNVFDSKNNVYKQEFTYATLVIDEAIDLDYFYLGNDRDASTFRAWTDADKFDGYYVLAKDINAQGYVFGATKEGEGETPKNLDKSGSAGTNNLQNMGLTGTFDGQGYSITNFAPNGAGLFAAINGGTVKNVSITNVAGANFNTAGSYLATILRDATIENVYIDCVKASGWATYAFARFILGETKLTNCIINVNMGTSNPSWGAMVESINATVTFENCYVISKFALNGTKTPASDASNIETTDTKFKGVKRYNTAADMIADAENNNYDSFLAQYWDKTSGMPVWSHAGWTVVLVDEEGELVADSIELAIGESVQLKAYKDSVVCDNPIIEVISGESVTVEGSKVKAIAAGESMLKVTYAVYGKSYEREISVTVAKESIIYGNTLTFSAADGLFFDEKGGVVSVAAILGDGVELMAATHTTDVLTISNGAILGLTTNSTSVTATQIVLESAGKTVTVNVNAYTLVIDEAIDLDYFYLGNDRDASTFGAWTDADKFDGYYVLAKDINAQGYVFGATKEGEGETPKNLDKSGSTGTSNLKNMGLTGTFDGQGYSITNFAPNGAGLFAAVNGGTVKNVSITNAAGANFNTAGSYLATILRDATIENVYIDCVKASGWATYAFARFILGETKLTNCIINVNMGTSNPSWGAMCNTVNATVTFENCYVISKFALNGTMSLAVDASNIETTGTKFEGVKRYNTAADMIADAENNNYDSFLEQYWDKTSGMPVWKN